MSLGGGGGRILLKGTLISEGRLFSEREGRHFGVPSRNYSMLRELLPLYRAVDLERHSSENTTDTVTANQAEETQ